MTLLTSKVTISEFIGVVVKKKIPKYLLLASETYPNKNGWTLVPYCPPRPVSVILPFVLPLAHIV
jgi:hypothetical protein